ncbi:hypothetical protein : Putative uncharacterized protein OS=uncultured Acidobacteria bacterium A2 PE=4 SV=1: DUF1501 [Gemmataceae bacterium]|nr:hypothetical protein : Putative uncharacterized protein OS=uncultured Acidobacteria bacterium A2 PE=4 SV=1: DUF1501 [Gemmataceae bacterium]VTT96446.1 hypothetical protein : Putative uncharacterized protein OS=uncultured Acidobacteria bacterium A2 PE=4 SV=1: DUF1501 [Gemmataceae bacterium]
MLTILGDKQRYCDGVSRRNFMKIGALGAGVTLADVLRARAGQDPTTKPSSSNKAAIMIYLPGGPSHIDMYDMKPEAPVEFRGEFRPIQTNVPGVQICEHMPLQARMWDKLSVVRSLVSTDEHSDSLVSTGFSENVNRTQGHPCFGSVVSKLRSGGANDVPPFVSLRGGGSPGTEPGFLGVSHRPFSPSGPGIENLRLANGIKVDRMDDRKNLLGQFDTIRRDIDASGTMKGMDTFAGRAFDMIASGTVRKALDLKNEDPKTRDRYKGVEQFLTARRLVEAGVGCVTLSFGGWDTHESNFKQLRTQLPQLDRGIASLIEDLHDRGMADDVVTVVWGEFGRTPKINNQNAGRDHWSPVMSALVAGGGLKMGQAIGASSARGEYPKDRPYKVPHLLSTVYQAMGIDASYTFPNGSGRPMYILDDREPVTELL